ncbi:MAG: TfoX/Sxy family protein [Chloroflexi bacterium]|nr:TfoX/Sxy family protein [Chloroflexota bacterium]
MAYNEELALRIRQSLGERSGIVERKMFGGLCFMAHGNMLGGVMGNEVIVRVGAERYEDALRLPHAREMDFTGRPMRGFVVVGVDGISSDGDLANWVGRGLEFALSLPPK